jgi:prepilin-type N-terminal cleavage/methylation domain-containing protein
MSNAHRRGFTLIEVIIVLAIVVVVGLFIVFNLFGGDKQEDLNSTVSQIVASLRQAQSQAMAQSQNAVWGVHFMNATSTGSYYALFSGSSYASGTVQGRYPLPPTVGYVTSTLSSGSFLDITFSGITGAPSASTSIGLYLIPYPTIQEYIYVNGIGQVSYNSSNCVTGIGPWAVMATALPANLSAQPAVVNNGYVYSIGGYNGTSHTSTVYDAQINGNGTLSNWSSTAVLPTVIGSQPAVVNNGYVYSIGGYTGSVYTSTVDYAQFNGNGTLSNWSSTTPLPVALGYEPAVVNNGYVYTIGGDTNGGVHVSSTYYAQFNGNGTLSNWSSTAVLPTVIGSQPAVVNNGYVYSIGNFGGSSTVDYAQINGNGTLSNWLPTTPLPAAALGYEPAVVNNGYVYTIGGNNSLGDTSTIYVAQFNGNGTLSNWSSTTALPATVSSQPAVVNNGYVYSIGGYAAGNYTSTVYYAPFCY